MESPAIYITSTISTNGLSGIPGAVYIVFNPWLASDNNKKSYSVNEERYLGYKYF